MICTILFTLLTLAISSQEALDAMIEGNPLPTAQEAALIEYGDAFMLPESPDMARFAILRQLHRMAFQMPQEPVQQLAEYITVNWGDLDTETRNLWREFSGRTGLPVPSDEVTQENLTSILRYASESGNPPPDVNPDELTDLQRFHYVNTLTPYEVEEYMNDPSWAIRIAVMQKNPNLGFEMLDDPSPYVAMNAALATGRSDLLLNMSSLPGPIGHMSLSGVGQVPILEDSLFRSSDPAIRAASLIALLELGWRIPDSKINYLLNDEYLLVGEITAEATVSNFAFPEPGAMPQEAPAIEDVPDDILIVTDAGDFTLTFYKDSAPVTCRSFWHLAETGFYDGIYFHRVIPGFVAQAGCPEGNGYGGPGYAIPAENNTEAFNKGVVGMADSGIDTGGSQFFIMLDSQRRLDCRYTVFGVVNDTSDLEKIEIGTRILEIRAVNP